MTRFEQIARAFPLHAQRIAELAHAAGHADLLRTCCGVPRPVCAHPSSTCSCGVTPPKGMTHLVAHPALSRDLDELVACATTRFESLSPSAQLRHRYMQRRSFSRGMCASSTPYATHCANVEKRMPHEAGLSDAQVATIMSREGASR